MSTRKTTLFYALLIAVASAAVGMVIASKLELAPTSSAQGVMTAPPANSAPLTGPVDASTFRTIAKSMSPSVVNIRTESRARQSQMTQFFGGDDDLLERFFGGGGGQQRRQQQERPQVTQAAGTGFIISAKDGLILTNNHVVEDATKIQVSFYGDDPDVSYLAKVVGRDQLTDSALIELTETPKRELTEVKFGDSAQMQPGDWVMAIGNPFGLAHTVSVGVISATERPFPITDGRSQDVLQTDAAINPGNSGGPLLNVRGEVVGINTAIYTDSRQTGNIGIGFAVPINTVRELLPQLRTGKVTRGVIGVSVGAIPLDSLEMLGLKERAGALVSSVNAGGPAAKAGVEPGDVIVEFNGKPVKNRDELVGYVTRTAPGSTVPVKVLRDKVEKRLSITIDELNLEAETARTSRDANEPEPEERAGEGFGMTVGSLTQEMARRLRLPSGTEGVVITDIEAGSPAQRGGLARGDVLLQVNRRPVGTVADAARELGKVASGSTAFLLVLRNGQESFVTVRKEKALAEGVEREIKLRVPSAEDARARVLALGATLRRGRRLQRDVIVDTADRALVAGGCALRVRDDDGQGWLTFKGAVVPGPLRVREEIETSAASAERLLAILAALGYTPVFRYEKFREELAVPGALIAIDETPIGTFLEIEGEAAAIHDYAGRLGFAAADYITASYRSLWVAAGGGAARAGDMTFGAVRS